MVRLGVRLTEMGKKRQIMNRREMAFELMKAAIETHGGCDVAKTLEMVDDLIERTKDDQPNWIAFYNTLSVRLSNALKRADINSFEMLMGTSQEKLAMTPKFGQSSQIELRRKLDLLGMQMHP